MTAQIPAGVDTTDLRAEVRLLCDQILNAHDDDATPRALIRALQEAGLLDPALLDDETTASAVIAATAAAGAPVPVVEHLWTAHRLLRTAGLEAPDGVLTAAAAEVSVDRLGEGLSVSGTVHDVPEADVADHLIILTDEGVLFHAPIAQLHITDTRSLGAQTWSTVIFDSVSVVEHAHTITTLVAADLESRKTSGRLAQLSAAAERATELTTEHLASREQFGRPLRRFQAAQNRLSACVGETIMLGIGADLAQAGRPIDTALARIDARRSVTVIRDHTHQLHGAMGITAEYPLGHLIASMLAWLADTGPDRVWLDKVGGQIRDTGPWATITGEEDEA
jgi:acyl-CoA dehydrogenase